VTDRYELAERTLAAVYVVVVGGGVLTAVNLFFGLP